MPRARRVMKTTFLRIVDVEDKEAALLTLTKTEKSSRRFDVASTDFSAIPRSPFAYWVSGNVLHLFESLPPLEFAGSTAKQGLATADDFRFVRLHWEVSPARRAKVGLQTSDDFRFVRLSWETNPEDSRKTWFAFAKGGKFSPYYADVYLTVNWRSDGAEIVTFCKPGTDRTASRPQNVEFFFRPGLTWPLRTTSGLSLRAMPRGCIFGHKGPAAFVEGDSSTQLLALLAIANGRAFSACVELQLAAADAAARSYEVGVLQRTPVPPLTATSEADLALLARRAWSLKRSLDTSTENSHGFSLPALLQVRRDDIASQVAAADACCRAIEEELEEIQCDIDERCFALYGIDDEDRQAITEGFGTVGASEYDSADEDADEGDSESSVDAKSRAASLVSWCVGVALGRFDIRLATGERAVPSEPGPFDPLPVCSPGMVTGDDGLPLAAPPPGYPIRWPEDGLLVDHAGHPRDLAARVADVLRVVFGERADATERALCQLLASKSLDDWLRKPASFFADHLARYSKSRRQAPIYWPLSTESGTYTIWLYMHRLTDQTLFLAVNELVEPKLRETEESLRRLSAKSATRTPAEDTELETLEDLATELRALRDELLRVAAFWKPDLDDGILITASPLWKLFRLGKWQKTLKETWHKLERGDYDWAHLAYATWPDRVREKCKSDKSIAIAHGLEHLYIQRAKPKTIKKQASAELADELDI